jgi:membrane protein DedA with SNARE-associated domain
MQEWLTHLIQNHSYLAYGIIVLVSFVEGPILAMICGVLYKLGIVTFLPIYIALMAGDLVGDSFWYSIGYYFGHPFIKKFGRYFSLTESGVVSVTRIFHTYKNSILLISKMTMGLGFALVTLVTAGIVKIPFRRYMLLNFIGQFFWTAFLLVVGYFLGDLYMKINGVFGAFFIGAIIVIAFGGLIGWGKYMKKRMSKAL